MIVCKSCGGEKLCRRSITKNGKVIRRKNGKAFVWCPKKGCPG